MVSRRVLCTHASGEVLSNHGNHQVLPKVDVWVLRAQVHLPTPVVSDSSTCNRVSTHWIWDILGDVVWMNDCSFGLACERVPGLVVSGIIKELKGKRKNMAIVKYMRRREVIDVIYVEIPNDILPGDCTDDVCALEGWSEDEVTDSDPPECEGEVDESDIPEGCVIVKLA